MEGTSPIHIQQSAPSLGIQAKQQIKAEGVEGFAKMMESVLLQQLLQQMNKSLVSGSLFGSSPQAKIYQGMFTENFAKTLADSGGIGLAKIISQQLEQKLLNAPDEEKTTHPTSGGSQVAHELGSIRDLQALKYQALLNREGIKADE